MRLFLLTLLALRLFTGQGIAGEFGKKSAFESPAVFKWHCDIEKQFPFNVADTVFTMDSIIFLGPNPRIMGKKQFKSGLIYKINGCLFPSEAEAMKRLETYARQLQCKVADPVFVSGKPFAFTFVCPM